MTDENTSIDVLKKKIKKFTQVRDWEQYHSAKNLSMALSVEVAELMELFQWLHEKEMNDFCAVLENKCRIEEEIADIMMYALSFANVLDIDVSRAIHRKLALNEKKYPVEKVKGKAHKYTYYQENKS